ADAPTYGLNHAGFKVQYRADLDEFQSRLEGAGVATKRFAAGELGPGSGETLRFQAPSDHTIELVYGMEQVGNMLPLHNPPPEPLGLVGIHPPRLDHLFLMCEDVDQTTA